jgi:hypothetical protein
LDGHSFERCRDPRRDGSLSFSLLLVLVYLLSKLLLTYSTSSRHGGQAKAGSDAPLAQPHWDEAGLSNPEP